MVVDQDFREFVVSALTELRTNLRTAIGEDGNGGRMSVMQKELDDAHARIATLESKDAFRSGAQWVIGIVSGGVFSAAEWLFHKK